MDTRKVAQQITNRLFRNGFGKEADRLVLELPGKRDGGGWCRKAAEDKICDALDAAIREAQ